MQISGVLERIDASGYERVLHVRTPTGVTYRCMRFHPEEYLEQGTPLDDSEIGQTVCVELFLKYAFLDPALPMSSPEVLQGIASSPSAVVVGELAALENRDTCLLHLGRGTSLRVEAESDIRFAIGSHVRVRGELHVWAPDDERPYSASRSCGLSLEVGLKPCRRR